MDLGLKDKKAFISAASYGLGRACAESLAQEGAAVAISARDSQRCALAAEEIESTYGVRASSFAADLSDEAQLRTLSERVLEEFGQPDIVVLSSGHPPTHAFSQASEADWQLGIDLLLRPVLYLSRAFVPGMQQRGYGRLILIGSIFGVRPEVSSIIQSTLRTGLTAFARCVAEEVAADGVSVNVICPGYFMTPLVERLAKQYAEARGTSAATVLEEWEKYPPAKRFGEPRELGDLVAFIASPRAQLIQGASLLINA